MTLVWGRGSLRLEHPSVVPYIAPSIVPCITPSVTPPDFFLPSKIGDKLSNQPAGFSRAKLPIADATATATSISKYSEDDLQRIFKAVLEAQAPAPAPAPTPTLAPVIFEMPREKLKARSLDVYCGKSHIDCYNFCQQYGDYFATARATRLTQILFALSFFQDQINFRWQ